MEAKKLKEILNKHLKWVNSKENGERANLCGANGNLQLCECFS